jgi:hypothetical protein
MFPSIKRFYSVNIEDWQLQDVPDDELDDHVLEIYDLFMERYRRDKHLIPEGRLVEVRFEDVEQDPLEELERIYAQLGLSGFEAARGRFQAYVDAQKDYQKNRYTLTREQIDRIGQRWSADIQLWGDTPAGAVEVVGQE